MAGGIPSGLGALLARLGLGGGAQPHGPVGVDVKALKKDGEKTEKGAVLGPDGQLLAGLGFNSADKHAHSKNLVEAENVARFMEPEPSELQKQLAKDSKEADGTGLKKPEEKADSKRARDDNADAKDPAAPDGALKDTKREEREDRAAGERLEAKEQRETHQAKDADEHHRQRDKDKDEDERHGQGWVAEELQEEEKSGKESLRQADVMGEHTRCHGLIEDGTRCLRKPSTGTPYCPEHAVQWQIRARRLEDI